MILKKASRWIAILLAGTAANCFAQQPQAHPDFVLGQQQSGAAVLIRLTTGVLRIKPCGNDIARVTFAPGTSVPNLSNPALSDSACGDTTFTVSQSNGLISINTPGLTIEVSLNSGAVRFRDAQGRLFLAETDWPYPRKITPTVTDGMTTNRAYTWFSLTPEESLYGLGQHETGLLNMRNQELELTQDNTNISIPFFLSSKGYGVLWNNGSATEWNNRFQQVLAIRSDVAKAVDYYFIEGPQFDRIIAGYRRLTGQAPLMPRWAYGYWQSKLAYATSQQLVDTVTKYRQLGIPLDNIVLDAGWETVFGSRTFTNAYPDPQGTVQALHNRHVQLMASIWPLYQPSSTNFDTMARNGWFIPGGVTSMPPYSAGTRLYDAFSSGARKEYWKQAKRALYDIGVDAFWLDSSEPSDLYAEEHGSMLAGAQTAMGNGSAYLNMYPLMTTSAIYDGQRSAGDKRAFILTRSAFLGMQRNAAAAWSGDTLTTFAAFKRQIPAGLNYSMSGLPYWTTDIGGFVGGDTNDPHYQELFVRWFEYGMFCPIFRAHGARPNNELWSYGDAAQRTLTLYDKLRYRLMPYIYSVAARTTFEGYTPMRALAFDFRTDPNALNISDEFLFGPSLLVAPVTDPSATARDVYLPAGTDWYDFWTGERLHGGQTVHRSAPLNVIPVYVRAGTVLPLGPEEQYTGESPDGPIELRIYPGADGATSLYHDDGTTYRYEKGAREEIKIQWLDLSKTLTFSAPFGNFPNAVKHQQFNVVIVSPNHGTGETIWPSSQQMIYAWEATQFRVQ